MFISGDTSAGLPKIEPVVLSNTRPSGNCSPCPNSRDHVSTTTSDERNGANFAISTCSVNEIASNGSVKIGPWLRTWMVSSCWYEPPLFWAVTVYWISGDTTNGTPWIIPRFSSKNIPDGRGGLMINEAIFPPELVTSIVLNAIPLYKRKFEVESENCGSGSNTSM